MRVRSIGLVTAAAMMAASTVGSIGRGYGSSRRNQKRLPKRTLVGRYNKSHILKGVRP